MFEPSNVIFVRKENNQMVSIPFDFAEQAAWFIRELRKDPAIKFVFRAFVTKRS